MALGNEGFERWNGKRWCAHEDNAQEFFSKFCGGLAKCSPSGTGGGRTLLGRDPLVALRLLLGVFPEFL